MKKTLLTILLSLLPIVAPASEGNVSVEVNGNEAHLPGSPGSMKPKKTKVQNAIAYVDKYPLVARKIKGHGKRKAYLFMGTRCPACGELIRTKFDRIVEDASEVIIVFNPLYKLKTHKAGIVDTLYILENTDENLSKDDFMNAYRYVKEHESKEIAESVIKKRYSDVARRFVVYLKLFSLDEVPGVYDANGKPFYQKNKGGR